MVQKGEVGANEKAGNGARTVTAVAGPRRLDEFLFFEDFPIIFENNTKKLYKNIWKLHCHLSRARKNPQEFSAAAGFSRRFREVKCRKSMTDTDITLQKHPVQDRNEFLGIYAYFLPILDFCSLKNDKHLPFVISGKFTSFSSEFHLHFHLNF